MGTSKPTILFQQVFETLIVSVAGFCLSIFIGYGYMGKVGEKLLNYQINTESQYDTLKNSNGTNSIEQSYFSTVSTEQISSNYNSNIDADVSIYALLTGIIIDVITTGVPCMMVLKQKPRELID